MYAALSLKIDVEKYLCNVSTNLSIEITPIKTSY